MFGLELWQIFTIVGLSWPVSWVVFAFACRIFKTYVTEKEAFWVTLFGPFALVGIFVLLIVGFGVGIIEAIANTRGE